MQDNLSAGFFEIGTPPAGGREYDVGEWAALEQHACFRAFKEDTVWLQARPLPVVKGGSVDNLCLVGQGCRPAEPAFGNITPLDLTQVGVTITDRIESETDAYGVTTDTLVGWDLTCIHNRTSLDPQAAVLELQHYGKSDRWIRRLGAMIGDVRQAGASHPGAKTQQGDVCLETGTVATTTAFAWLHPDGSPGPIDPGEFDPTLTVIYPQFTTTGTGKTITPVYQDEHEVIEVDLARAALVP